MAPLREAAAQVRGRHYTEWVPELDELKAGGTDGKSDYHALLSEIIDAAERETVYTGLEPPPGCYTRAAIVHRRRGEIDAEIAVLERWLRVTPADRRGGKVSDRLAKALALRAKQQTES